MATLTGYASATAPVLYYDRVEWRGYVVARKAKTVPGHGGKIKQATAVTVEFYVTAWDGTAKIGLVNADFTIKNLSKAGAAPAAITPTITEVGGGWYSLPFTTAHTSDEGILTLAYGGPAFDTQGWSWQVSSIIDSDVSAAVAAIQTDITTLKNGTIVRQAQTGAVPSGGPNDIKLDAAASAVNDAYRGLRVSIYAGTGAGQARWVSSYTGATKVALIDKVWNTIPDATSFYTLSYDVGFLEVDDLSNSVATLIDNVGSLAGADGLYARFLDVFTAITGVQTVVDAIQTLTTATLDLNVMAVYIEAQAARIRTTDVQARIPASLTGDGRMDSNVGAMQANVITSGALDATAATEIANAVLDAARTGHVATGSIGEGVALSAALLQGNFYMDNVTNTSNGQTAARLRVFHTGAAAAAATAGGSGQGEFATFLVTTVYSGPSQVAEHRVVQQ